MAMGPPSTAGPVAPSGTEPAHNMKDLESAPDYVITMPSSTTPTEPSNPPTPPTPAPSLAIKPPGALRERLLDILFICWEGFKLFSIAHCVGKLIVLFVTALFPQLNCGR